MRRRGIDPVTPVIIGILMIIATVALANLFIFEFGDEVAYMITKMPRLHEYDYVTPVIGVCRHEGGGRVEECAASCRSAGGSFDEGSMTCRGPSGRPAAAVAEPCLDFMGDGDPAGYMMMYESDGEFRSAFHDACPGMTIREATGTDGLFPAPIDWTADNPHYEERVMPSPLDETVAELASRSDEPASRIAYYYALAGIGIGMLVVAMLLAAAKWMIEDTPLIEEDRRDGIRTIKSSAFAIVYIMLLPLVWDPAAIFLENAALLLMAVDGRDPGAVTLEVVRIAGSIYVPDLNPEGIFNALWLNQPGLYGNLGDALTDAFQGIVLNTVMAMARALSVTLTMVAIFITSVVRVEITMLAVMLYPLALGLRHLPYFKENAFSAEVVRHLQGAVLAPVLGAIIFAGGYATLLAGAGSASSHAIEAWLTSLIVLILASTIPTATMGWVGKASQAANQIVMRSLDAGIKTALPVMSAAGAMLPVGGLGRMAAGGAQMGMSGLLGAASGRIGPGAGRLSGGRDDVSSQMSPDQANRLAHTAAHDASTLSSHAPRVPGDGADVISAGGRPIMLGGRSGAPPMAPSARAWTGGFGGGSTGDGSAGGRSAKVSASKGSPGTMQSGLAKAFGIGAVSSMIGSAARAIPGVENAPSLDGPAAEAAAAIEGDAIAGVERFRKGRAAGARRMAAGDGQPDHERVAMERARKMWDRRRSAHRERMAAVQYVPGHGAGRGGPAGDLADLASGRRGALPKPRALHESPDRLCYG